MLLPFVLTASQIASQLAAPSTATQAGEPDRMIIPCQVVVSYVSSKVPPSIDKLVAEWNLSSLEAPVEVERSRKVLQWRRRNSVDTTTVVLLEFGPASRDLEPAMAELRGMAGVEWVAPNVGMLGDPRSLVPNDPSYSAQYHHPQMSNDRAWDITQSDASVIIGITDDGVDLGHEDLAPNIWTNPGEIPGDGIDNDGNGYVDDIHGYDFVADDGDPSPSGDHGTHVAGIAAARTGNGLGVSGTAGRASIMALKFFEYDQPWTAIAVADAFVYATDNGCRIINTSYQTDLWLGDPIVTAAFDYLYDRGVLHFNAAGNANQPNAPVQGFHQTMVVASTAAGDARSSFSNTGTGCDICAPGSNVLAPTLNDGYAPKSGTSMAAPNAAGAAALIWSAHPTWTRDQVAAQLMATSDSIDIINPGYVGLLGGGRVNSFRALTETLPAPRVASTPGLPSDGATLVSDLTAFTIRTDQILDPASVNVGGGLSLTGAGPDGQFGTTDDIPVTLDVAEYLFAGNGIRASLQSPLASAGLYRVELNGSVITNPFGTALDGDGDGMGGDSWAVTFTACGATESEYDNAESGIGWSVTNESVSGGAWTVPPEVPLAGGVRRDPPTDFDGSGRCFLTGNAIGDSDVDGGPTRLISRSFDVSAVAEPHMGFAAWLGTTGGDPMTFEISDDDGLTWAHMETIHGTTGWEIFTYRIADYVSTAGSIRLRFSVADLDTGSVTEAAIDAIRVVQLDCATGGGPIGTSYCSISPNSAGAGAAISASGSTRLIDNSVTLEATGLPPGQFGIFFTGDMQTLSPLGNGFLCIDAASITRLLPVANASPAGGAITDLDLATAPMANLVAPGATSNFQLWFRDSVGSGSNLTDAIGVTWQ